MHFPTAKIISAFMAFQIVAANLHDNCVCHNGDSYNSRLTTLACEAYDAAKYEWGGTAYSAETGRCAQRTPGDQLGGKEWTAACRQIASAGFQCTDGQGTCYANPDEVNGEC